MSANNNKINNNLDVSAEDAFMMRVRRSQN